MWKFSVLTEKENENKEENENEELLKNLWIGVFNSYP